MTMAHRVPRIGVAAMTLLVVGAGIGCRDQRAACSKAIGFGRADADQLVERCVRENWSERKTECMVSTGGGLRSMFCAD
jgi:hypothetical protein